MFKVYKYSRIEGRRVDTLQGEFATLEDAREFMLASPADVFIQYPTGRGDTMERTLAALAIPTTEECKP